MKLIENWREAYKWFSIHIAAILALLNGLQASVGQVQGFLTPQQLAVTNAVLGVLVIWARLISQSK